MDDLALTRRGRHIVFLVGHVAGPAGSSLTPRATISSDPSGSGRCSFRRIERDVVLPIGQHDASDRDLVDERAGGELIQPFAAGSPWSHHDKSFTPTKSPSRQITRHRRIVRKLSNDKSKSTGKTLSPAK